MLCLQTYHSFSGGQGTCYGEGFLLSPKTLPLSAHLPFFYGAVWDLPVCLTAASVLCVLSLYTEQGTRTHHPHWDAGTATPGTVLTQTN